MKVKVSEATNLQLNWLVGSALRVLGLKPMTCSRCEHHEERAGRDDPVYYCHHPKSRHETDYGWGDAISPDYGTHSGCPISDLTPEPYTTNPSKGLPIIEQEGILLRAIRREGHPLNGSWLAMYDGGNTGTMVQWVKRTDWKRHYLVGPTMLVAGLRCFVVSRMSYEVEIPEDLK